MESQALGTLAAAVITATAGLLGVALTRRVSARHQRFQEMRNEAELLAALPEDHPMRDELSNVIGIRIRAYAAHYHYGLAHEPSLKGPVMTSLGGLLLTVLVLSFDRQIGVSDFVRATFSGEVSWLGWDAENKLGMLGFFVAFAGQCIYVMAGIGALQIFRDRDWRYVMRVAYADISRKRVSDPDDGEVLGRQESWVLNRN